MGKRTFHFTFEGEATVEIDDACFEAARQPDFKEYIYDLNDEQVAEMIGRCLCCEGWKLSNLDGFADQPDDNAEIMGSVDWETTEVKEAKA